MRRRLLLVLAGAATAWLGRSQAARPPMGLSGAEQQAALREDLQQHGLVLLIRHARTEPGLGDPPGYRLGECSTQRNLSEEGREQARRLGEALKAQGLEPRGVRSSAWCRCVDTAALAFGRPEVWPPLNSFFDAPEAQAATARALREGLVAVQPGRLEAWVTHQVNITALTGVFPAPGEVLVLRGGQAEADVRWRLMP